MIRKIPLEAITALLVTLFVYTAVSKILDAGTFSEQMHNQPLPRWLTGSLVWIVPSIELIIAGLLLIRPLRIYGLLLSFFLLLIFTVYVSLVISHSFEWIPCSCGGVLKSMSWETHLVFNIGFTLLALTGTCLERTQFFQFQKHSKDIVATRLPDQRAQGNAENLKQSRRIL